MNEMISKIVARPVNGLMNVDAAAVLIEHGVPMSVAGTEAALDRLPRGNWIGGTIPYFMLAGGGAVINDETVFVTDLSSVGMVSVRSYGPNDLEGIVSHAPANGFTIAIIPSGGECHRRFAEGAADCKDAFLKPLVGWIAGVHLADIGTVTPKVYDGRAASKSDDRAVVAYVELTDDRFVSVDIVNPFEPDGGDVLRFEETSLEVGLCRMNGHLVNLAKYLEIRGFDDGKLPLVGDHAGAYINVSFQSIDVAGGKVKLYAPVFPGVDYRMAKPVEDYAAAFRQRFADLETGGAVFACHSVLNFMFGELQGKVIGGVEGPASFGEIAYLLLNQTAVLLRVM